MALNRDVFKTRTITALLFAFVMLGGILWNAWSFLMLFSIIHFGCWREYQQLIAATDAGYGSITPLHRYGVMIAGWALLLYASGDPLSIYSLRVHEIGWWLGLVGFLALPVIALFLETPFRPRNIGYSVLGLLYISCSWSLLTDLYQPMHVEVQDSFYQIGAAGLVMLMIASIWINDTMAYIVGSLFGRTPLSSVSPKKTWEGTIGGVALTITLVSVLCRYVVDWGDWDFLVIGVSSISAVAGTLGDLLESKLKRMAGVKDSGHFMPGHGGFLDRFDSMLIATPFVWLFVKLIEAGMAY